MVNQDPQPEIFNVTFNNFAITANGSTASQQIFTNQGHSEQVLIYAMKVNVFDENYAEDLYRALQMQISVGSNNIPSNAFDIGWIAESGDKIMNFPVPIAVNFKQPLILTLRNMIASTGSSIQVVVELIGETMILKR